MCTQRRTVEIRSLDKLDDVRIAKHAAEKEKWEKYQELCGNYQALFFTAAVESTGGIGKEFRYIINLIGENAVSVASGYETGEVVGVLHSSVAVAVQNGCGRIIRDNRIKVIRINLKRSQL